MVPKFIAGFEPSAAYTARRSSVELGRFLALCDRASPHWRDGVYVGHTLRLVAAAAFLLSHRVADRVALGLAHPRLRPPGAALADGDYRRRAYLFAISAARAQHELCVSRSPAASGLGNGLLAPDHYSRGIHCDFLLAHAPCVSEDFSPGSRVKMKVLLQEDSKGECGNNGESRKMRKDVADGANGSTRWAC